MKKVSKGTTLVEIMISVMLISVILIFIFNILADLKAEDNLASKRSEDALARASYTRIIQNDFINNVLTGVNSCSDGLICLNFTFKNNTQKQLKIYDKYIVYDNEKWSLTYGSYSKDNAEIEYRYSSTTSSNPDLIKYSYLKIIVPVIYNTLSNRKYDLELVYNSEGNLNINCNSLGFNKKNCNTY